MNIEYVIFFTIKWLKKDLFTLLIIFFLVAPYIYLLYLNVQEFIFGRLLLKPQ